MTKRKPKAPPDTVQIAKGPELPYVPPSPQPAEKSASVWKQITTEADNQTHDVGFVAVACLGLVVLGAIPILFLMTVWAQGTDPLHKFDPQPLGIAIGAICGGFATALAALGAYRLTQGKGGSNAQS